MTTLMICRLKIIVIQKSQIAILRNKAVPPNKILKNSQRNLLEDGSIKQEEFQSIFSIIRRQDILLHHPYDLFSTSVEEFINQAADDPLVMGIKMTLYRISKDSPIIAALIHAAEN